MTIAVVCSKCRKRYKVAERMAGKRIRCKQCEAAIRVPDDEFGDDDFGDDGYETARPLPRRSRPSKRKSAKKKKVSKSGQRDGARSVSWRGLLAAFFVVWMTLKLIGTVLKVIRRVNEGQQAATAREVPAQAMVRTRPGRHSLAVLDRQSEFPLPGLREVMSTEVTGAERS